MKNNTPQTKSLTIGEVTDAIEVLVKAANVIGIEQMGAILTDRLYASHDDSYLRMLCKAGSNATNIFLDHLHD